jgi:PAS domain S-box-containing protein
LRHEVEAHKRTLRELETTRSDLERRVAARTRELEHAKARLEALIKASAQIFWATDPDGQVVEDSPSWREFTGQTYDDWKGAGWLNAVHPDDRGIALAAWRAAVESKSNYLVEYRVHNIDGGYRWTSAHGVPLLDDAGEVTEWVGMNEDISQRKRAEEHSSLIMRELSHRTKNLLAVIASLARRTFRDSQDARAQSADFVDRIHGLARSHDLLVRGDWHAVSLADLIWSHLEPFGFDDERIVVEGPDIPIKPEAAQSIGLALHELATNATKHGLLKGATGRLHVSWQIEDQNGPPTLALEWREETTSTGEAPKSSGFGRLMLQQLVGASVSGSTEYDLTDTQVIWRLNAPLEGIGTKTA